MEGSKGFTVQLMLICPCLRCLKRVIITLLFGRMLAIAGLNNTILSHKALNRKPLVD